MPTTRFHRLAALAGLLIATTLVHADVGKLARLFEERARWEAREFPEEAIRRGDDARADQVAEKTLDAIERRHRETVEQLTWLHAIERRHLRGDALLNYELFERRLQDEIDDHRFRMSLAPIRLDTGPHIDIPRMAEGIALSTAKDYVSYFARLRRAAAEVDDLIARMRIGLAEGRTPARVAVADVPARIDALLEGDGLDAIAAPLDQLPPHLDRKHGETFEVKLRYEAMPEIRGALTRLRDFLAAEYIPGCREAIAATALADGEAYYAHRLRKLTATDATADALHELGRAEVERIRDEMVSVIRRTDYLSLHPEDGSLDDDALLAAFAAFLRSEPGLCLDTENALLAGYREICKRVDALLPKYFRTLPRLPYGVRPVPAFMALRAPTAFHEAGSIENAEPGWFLVNTSALERHPRYDMIALALREAVPGHHLRATLARELDDVPEFRRRTRYEAYNEGWALYAVRLGVEMGLYGDPYDDFGRLRQELRAASRLVADTGIHALGWSRKEAIASMVADTALPAADVEPEIDRIIAWPGHACAAKIGEQKIIALRAKAEAIFARNFDIREFHDVVLGAGSVPLDVLERRVDEWIRSKPGGVAYD